LQGILYIDYGFHLTLEIASIALAYCFVTLLVGRRKESMKPPEEQVEMADKPPEPAVQVLVFRWRSPIPSPPSSKGCLRSST
jgi:hypothetical protein